MSNFAYKVTSAAPCHTVFVRTKRKRFAYVKAGNGQDRVSCVVGGGVRCSQQGVGGESLPIPQPVWRFGTLRQALQRDAHAIGRREHPDLAGILPKEGRKPIHRTEPNGRTLHDYDIVYGPIANDRIGAQITRYKQGYISFEEFLKRIQYIKGITFQYAFCTQRAIDKLIKQTSR